MESCLRAKFWYMQTKLRKKIILNENSNICDLLALFVLKCCVLILILWIIVRKQLAILVQQEYVQIYSSIDCLVLMKESTKAIRNEKRAQTKHLKSLCWNVSVNQKCNHMSQLQGNYEKGWNIWQDCWKPVYTINISSLWILVVV